MADRWAYPRLVRAQLRAQASYRASFVIDLISATLSMSLELVAVLVLFRVTPRLAGFGIRETFLISALALLAFALADLPVGNVDKLRRHVRVGTLDALLTRPRSVLGQLVATDFALRRIGQVVQGVLLVAVGVRWAQVRWTWWRALLVVVSPICGAVFFMALFVATATVAFYWTESGEFAAGFTYGGRTLSTYPITIYSGLFRRVFAVGLGFAFVAYYPALALLGRPDPLGGPGWLAWLGPPVAAAAVGLAGLAWRTGIRHYQGAGS